MADAPGLNVEWRVVCRVRKKLAPRECQNNASICPLAPSQCSREDNIDVKAEQIVDKALREIKKAPIHGKFDVHRRRR